MEPTEKSVYHTFSDVEKQQIHVAAQELEKLLRIWAPLYPIVRAGRIPPVSVLIATVLPELPSHLSLLVGKLILFIFAVDDAADERLLSYVEFLQAVAAWDEIARYGHAAHPFERDGGLSGMLYEIRRELAQSSTFPGLSALWASRLSQLARAMANEYEYGLRYQAAGKETLPSLDTYIEGGIHSVGFPFWGTSVLILLSEPVFQEHLYPINEILIQTGAAIRLYNDVRTYQKEVAENNINALTILQNTLERKHPEFSDKQRFEKAQDTVIHLANQFAEKCTDMADQFNAGTGRFEQMIRRIVAFHANFYGSRSHNHDYHTISSSDTYSLLIQ